MTQVRAWLRSLDPGSWVVIVAIAAILAAIVLSPPVPSTAYPPPSTAAYGQPDTMLDILEDRVYTSEETLYEQERRITELETRVEELERERR